MVIDGEEQPNSLFKLVKSTQENTNPNNKIKFSDNSRYFIKHFLIIVVFIFSIFMQLLHLFMFIIGIIISLWTIAIVTKQPAADKYYELVFCIVCLFVS